jgi:hypothetical protein
MYRTIFVIIAFLLFDIGPSVAQSCNREEDCKKSCGIMRPFGCISRVDDPVCVARREACRFTDPVIDRTGQIFPGIVDVITNKVRIPRIDAKNCLQNISAVRFNEGDFAR